MIRNPSTSDIAASFNMVQANSAVPWGAANGAIYLRSRGSALISKIALHVSTQSGNICVGVYRGLGSGRSRVPDARIATSGAVSCPAPGYSEVSLGGSVYITDGDFLALSCDNTTAAFLGASGNNSSLSLGFSFSQSTAHVLPSSAASLTPTSFRLPQLVGVV